MVEPSTQFGRECRSVAEDCPVGHRAAARLLTGQAHQPTSVRHTRTRHTHIHTPHTHRPTCTPHTHTTRRHGFCSEPRAPKEAAVTHGLDRALRAPLTTECLVLLLSLSRAILHLPTTISSCISLSRQSCLVAHKENRQEAPGRPRTCPLSSPCPAAAKGSILSARWLRGDLV